MKKIILLEIIFLLFFIFEIDAQTVSWGPSVPAVTSEDITTCYGDGDLTFQFTNVGLALTDLTFEVQLDTGIYYIEDELSYTSSGSATVGEDDLSDLNRPIFYIGSCAAGEQISVTIKRTADCEARTLKVNGSTFIDTIHVYEAGTEVTYSNGIANGTVNYEIVYGVLSITSANTSPSSNNVGGISHRTINITNGSFGEMDQFYFTDIFNAGDLVLSNFRINPTGINHLIPAGNITVVGDSVIIKFLTGEIAAINGSGGTVGDGDALFEKDETFVLDYEVSSTFCAPTSTIPSKLLAWYGCSYGDRCQETESAASLGLTNTTPSIALSNAIRPRLDFCDTVTYSVTLTNNSTGTTPPGGEYAKDVTAFLGFRHNQSPVSTLSNITQWGTGRYNTKHFTNHKLNGHSVTLPTIGGLYGTVLPYLPPNYFAFDPDGPGGLADVDGDGFYDDLPEGEVLVISYGVYITPLDFDCDLNTRKDYIAWEHIAADISWHNQCGVLMSPKRQEFNYTNHIRNYLNSTFIDAPTDVVDGEGFSVGIKPHLYTSIYCNGASGTSGAGVDWVTQIVMPPGLSLQAGYDPAIYTLSNDTVTTHGAYSYSWTNFPLIFNCADWDGTNPLSFTISTFYICGDGVSECYKEEVHCYDIELIVPHCPNFCPGITPISFTSDRISESWTDNTKTALVDLNDPSIVKDFVYPYDTVEFYITGVFSDTMSDQLYSRITYSPQSGGNIFSFEEGTIEIVDVDGQYNGGTTNYTFPLTTPPTINSLGGNDYEMVFNLSSYRTSIDANYLYGQSAAGAPSYDNDTIKLKARVVISSTMAFYAPWSVENFRSTFYIYDASSNEVSCDTWGSTLDYERPYSYAGNNERANSGCNEVEKYFYITHQALTGDDHPNEYRPPYHIDSAVMKIPLGWEVGDVTWIDNTVMNSSDYELKPDGTLILRRPPGYKDRDKRNTYYPKFRVKLTPNCQAIDGRNYIDYTAYLKDYAYLTDASSHVPRTTSKNTGFINYDPPTFSIIPLNQTVTAYKDTVQWVINVCNSTSDMDVDFNWLLLSDDDNQIQVDSVIDITGGGSTLLSTTTTLGGETYVQIGALDQGDCSDIVIYSSFTSCERDTLNIDHGWSCSSYPATADVIACGAESEVYVLPQSAQISATITPLASTPSDPSAPGAGLWGTSGVDMCTPFPAEVTVLNSQSAYLYDVSLKIKIPSAGSGFTYVPGSATIEVEGIDVVNTPRSIGAIAEAALVTASNNGDLFWNMTLAELDPTNYGSGEPLSGTLNSSNNEFILRWEMEPTCDLTSGDVFYVIKEGNDPCGSPASGSGEQVKSYPINLNGAVSPYFAFITTTLTPNNTFDGCSDSKNIDLDLLLAGGSTGATDTLSVVLPEGIGYGGSYACATPGKCPTYVGSSIIGGQEVLSFKYPNAITGNIEFSFDIETDDRGSCTPSDAILFQSKSTIAGLSCGVGSCPSTDIITGTDDVSVIINKPILDVAFTYLLANTISAPYTYSYDIDISNTGIDTENDVIVEFYSLNGAGNDITGSAIFKDTLTSILTNGSTTTLSGVFGSNHDPAIGIAVLIVPQYDNCYCTALESMADKSAGLSEIPHDIISNITVFNLAVDLDDDNDGIPDADERRVCSGTWVNIAAWTMNGGAGSTATTSDTDATIRNQTLGSGWDSWNISGSALNLNSTTLPQSLNDAIAGDYYVEYTILPGSGKAFEVGSLGWGWTDFSNTPKHDFKVAIFASTNNNNSAIIQDISRPNDVDNYIWQNNSVSEPFTSDILDSIVFKIYMYQPTVGIGGAAINNGTIIWDDFAIGGYHAPLDDCDGDGIPNIYDLDSDNDGILDGVEAGHGGALTAGRLTGTMGNNGLDNAVETSNDSGVLNYTIANTDGDAKSNPYDWDSDDDGCFDAIEGDGSFSLSNVDSDGALTGGVDANGIPLATAGGQATTAEVIDASLFSQCSCGVVRTNRHISIKVIKE